MISKESILVILGSPIAYYTAFAKVLGGVEEGIFTSQFFYWYGRGYDPAGWIYKTQEDIEDETGLTRRNQETARKNLRMLGVLEEKRMGVPSKLYYRLNLDQLFALVDAWAAPPSAASSTSPEVRELTVQDGGFAHPRMAESAILGCTNPPSKNVRFRHPRMADSATQECTNPPHKNGGIRQTNTKNTTKTTSKTTTENTSSSSSGVINPNDDDASVTQNNLPALSSKQHEQTTMTMRVIRELAKAIIGDMGRGVWSGYEALVDGCTTDELKHLITWLWLWDITEGPSVQNTVERRERKKFYHQPFDGVRSIPGKIVTQVRLGHQADLRDNDQAALQRCLEEWAEEIAAEESPPTL